ncbi:hypothetical protein B0T14DRAFT_272883 [Immersiella caudata]|uniref:Fungal N-terminal domain-containing protein n=1 Tax=Immersiella caudata TaxID=314043 RepID=A0AA39WLF3_9PEZI|nr:hypothetical protein B0T14DRAFT_272883 [Immersiella caudata]
MDPLSIAASVAGLLAAGGKFMALLAQISRLSDAPPLCAAVITELTATASVLRQTQILLDDRLQCHAERKSLVLLEHVATALTGLVMAKDELETMLDDLGLIYSADSKVTGIFDRARWMRKESDIQKLVQRLQNHKSSLNLVLTVLQGDSITQLQASVTRLHDLFEEAVLSNAALASKLSRLEGNSTVGCAETVRTSAAQAGDDDSLADDNSVKTISGASQSKDLLHGAQQLQTLFDFDSQLQDSKVYRKLLLVQSDGHSETSITTSHRQKAAASIFSTISLADISNLSQYSLPIFFQEIGNNRWYIHVGKMTDLGGLEIVSTGIKLRVNSLWGRRKECSVKPTDTPSMLKNQVTDNNSSSRVALIYSDASGRLFKLDPDKTFADQGITSKYGRLDVVPSYRAGGGDGDWDGMEVKVAMPITNFKPRPVQDEAAGFEKALAGLRRRIRPGTGMVSNDGEAEAGKVEWKNVNQFERLYGG